MRLKNGEVAVINAFNAGSAEKALQILSVLGPNETIGIIEDGERRQVWIRELAIHTPEEEQDFVALNSN
ncbi:MAG: hypothetical protein ABIG32_01165 [Candidatus Uhrbacteria bacterium]|nr:hypothetical protein [Patescibacteria group bacterium]MBU1906664.1 hypothetical protein [Patescibacteria group bacterium]